jgi:hypothetical protein
VTIFRILVRFLPSRPAPLSPGESTFRWVSKHGAYIFDLIKEAQELVRAKLVTINGFLRTMTKTDLVKWRLRAPSTAENGRKQAQKKSKTRKLG